MVEVVERHGAATFPFRYFSLSVIIYFLSLQFILRDLHDDDDDDDDDGNGAGAGANFRSANKRSHTIREIFVKLDFS